MNALADIKQSLLAFAYIADLSSGLQGSAAEIARRTQVSILRALDNADPIKGQWELAWGPVVYKLPFAKLADNTMYVARHRAQSTRFVIAIAGTNAKSLSDWVVEDFFVGKQTPWPYAKTANSEARISEGTHIGLTILQHMSPLQHFPATGLTLSDFLRQQAASSADLDIVVTGHSLGGALGVAAAQWLHDTRDDWCAGKAASLRLCPFAGPTPGNNAFAELVNSTFPGEALLVINNRLDTIPKSWESQALAEIPDLYLPDLEPGPLLRKLQEEIAEAVKPLHYAFVGSAAQREILPGKVQLADAPKDEPDKAFLRQVAYQHVEAYPQLLGLPELSAQLDPNKSHA